MNPETSEWIRPRHAVALLSPVIGSDKAAKDLIAQRFKDGLLTASARYMTEAFDFGAIPAVFTEPIPNRTAAPDVEAPPLDRGFPSVSESQMGSRFVYREVGRDLRRLILGGAIPSFSHDWEKDVATWNWSAGTMVFRKPAALKAPARVELPDRLRRPTRLVVYGVEFDRREVEKIGRSFGSVIRAGKSAEPLPPLCSPIPSGPSKGGMYKDAERWTNFWTQVAALLREGRLSKRSFHSQAELREEIIILMGPRPFGDDAIKKPVREIWRVFVEPAGLH